MRKMDMGGKNMHKVFLFSNTEEAAPYMDEKILRYIDEQITES